VLTGLFSNGRQSYAWLSSEPDKIKGDTNLSSDSKILSYEIDIDVIEPR